MRCSVTLMHLPRPILGAVVAALLAPQAAQAATLDGLGACYRSVDPDTRELVPVHGRGFTPGQAVTVSIDGGVVKEGVIADTNGEVIGSVPAPHQPRGERPFMLTVTEVNQPANIASAASRVTALALRLKPRRAGARRRVRFIGRGFTDGTSVYAHYIRSERHRRTVRLGTPQGPCGRIDVKRRQFPFEPTVGRWTLQVDNQPAFSDEPVSVFVRLGITVRRTARPTH
jgi:hypothetical protein